MISIVLVEPRNPNNVGAAARAMANFGFTDLRLVNVYKPSLDEMVSAVGAADIVEGAKFYDTLPEALADCTYTLATTSLKNRRPEQEVVFLPDIADTLKREDGHIGIVFGQEKRGLSNEDITLCSAILNIPSASKTPSINLAQAVNLCCYEMSKSFSFIERKKTVSYKKATASETEILVREAERLMENTRVQEVAPKAEKENMIRRILASHNLTKDQVFMLKQIAERLNKLL
ncbi:tRNA/rRNA methyltransferase [Parelusimicrobium proximum]|uniref:RNA methyltransferase n=1 Tax=Parelusimicrobium proximum TaxID=3228953 RepID=UPI003D182ACB